MRYPSRSRRGLAFFHSPFVRFLISDPWLRVAAAGLLILVASLGLGLPKIWRGSPPGFQPAIRVSGLDLIQGWSLRRNARMAAATGRFEDAQSAWLAALANNQGDAEAARGALRTHLAKDGRDSGPTSPLAGWLLTLTRTNLADLELAAQVWERNEDYGYVMGWLEPRQAHLSLSLAGRYLKSLFHLGKMTAFETSWSQVRDRLSGDEELALYHAAFQAGWGPPSGAAEGVEHLDAALERSVHRVLASRLRMTACAERLDPDGYERALDRLEGWKAATLLDHVGYWRLLARVGLRGEALRREMACPRSPSSANEVIHLANFYVEAAARARALDLFRRFLPLFAGDSGLWLQYAARLIEAEEWDELRHTAVRMRGRPKLRQDLTAYTYYLEGKAEMARQRPVTAAAAFQQMGGWTFEPVGLGLVAADDLLRFGYPELARAVLLPAQDHFRSQPGYWSMLFKVAVALKDEELMLSASERAVALRPRDAIVLNDRAATLLIRRERPGEAIQIAFQLWTDNPGSVVATINYAAALIFNGRLLEAETLLRSVPLRRLAGAPAALLRLDLFELYFGLGRYAQASAIYPQIELEHLYPTQVRRLEHARQAMLTGARAAPRADR